MNQTRKFEAVVIGKWIKGTIWKRPYLSVKLTESMIVDPYQDYPVKMAFWSAVDKGSKITITMELDEDVNLWYPV